MLITNLTDDTMINLETFHFAAARHIQGLPANASNYGSIVTAGWKSLSAHCDIIRLLFVWRLLLLPMNCIYKRVLISRLLEMFYNVDKAFIGPTHIM